MRNLQVERIVSHDNGDWGSAKYIHYCKVGCCPHECTSAEDSLDKAKSMVRLSLGMGMQTAEVYRWKGVEDANCYYHRGRAQHEIFSNGFKLQWDRKACDAAITSVNDAQDVEQLTFSTLNSAKAGLIIRDMDKDQDNITSSRLTLLTWPTQRYLNATFAADNLSCDFMNKQALDPEGRETQQARAKLFKANMSFFNGSRGEMVMSDYMSMIADLNSTSWEGWRGDEDSKLKYALKLAVPMVGAWRRLVVHFTANDAFELMGSSECDGVETYDLEKLKSLSRTLSAKRLDCEDCLDL